jgi:hypothetical protein
MHAKALEDPIYQYELGLAIEASDGELAPFCNGCHAPVAVMSGELSGQDFSGLSAASRSAVFCDFCHQVTGRTGDRPGNSSYELASPDGTKRAQLDDAKSPYHETAYSAFHESAEFCGNCHDVFHPVNGLQLEATYTEWSEGPYAAEGIVCQDCHMTPGPGVTKPNPGKAAAFAPERQHIYWMTFAGGNVALGDAILAEERLQAAAEIDLVVPQELEPGATGQVDVTVTNVGAGHYIPTGLTEFRQMWLEVTATGSDGESQLIGEHRYGLELADEQGNHPVPLWEAVSIAVDDRIPPRESVSYSYDLTMPSDGRVDIDATLYYRSVSEEVADAAGVDVPTTTMVSASQVIGGMGASDDGEGPFDTTTLLVAVGALVGLVAALGLVFFLRGRGARS